MFVLALCALAPSLLASHDPDAVDPARILLAPTAAHPFGTDQLGRGVFSRVIHGARMSLGVSLGATTIALVTGSLIGLVSGFAGGWLDGLLMRFVDVLLTFPALLLALVVVAILGPATTNVAVAVGLSNLAVFARLMRGEVLRARGRQYVAAALVAGVRPAVVLYRHIVPNTAGPVVSLGMIG